MDQALHIVNQIRHANLGFGSENSNTLDQPCFHAVGLIAKDVLDAGAEDVNDLGEAFEVVSEPTDLLSVRTALQGAGIDYESAESSFVPSMSVPLEEDGARKVFKLIDALEDCDDVQNVYANFDVSDDVMALIDA